MEHDGISWNQTRGFYTMFAHVRECEATNISVQERDNAIDLTLRCGGFSYALIPREYSMTLGVTGTLESLSPKERAVLGKDFSIKKATVIPSVYGTNKLQFAKGDSR
jgi:hypothetical protein